MTDSILIIGGGHNGLACAAYLARAGRRVEVLEAGSTFGGAATTREFAPGFRVSAVAHLLNQFDQGVHADLALAGHGLELAASGLNTIALARDGDHLEVVGDQASGAGISQQDQAALIDYEARMQRFARLLASLYRKAPPRLGGQSRKDLLQLARFALKMRWMGREDMREFMRIIGINMFDVLEEQFTSPLLKGALALDSVLGNHLGPRSNNTVFNALHRRSGGFQGWGRVHQPRGGMGAVSEALANAARAHGAILRNDCRVRSIDLDGDRVKGVTLESGESLTAGTVISNADPRTTFLDLLGARHLEAGFAARISHVRSHGNTAKLHVALNGAPRFKGLDVDQLGHRLVVSPDLDYLDRAFNHAKYGEFSTQTALEISIPTVNDPDLAPAGQHVLSAVVQYAPYQLKGGWQAHREAFSEQLLDQLDGYAPGLRDQVLAVELLTPVDIEQQFGMTGGHWHHAELTLDQALMLRPVPAAAQHATPVTGLYLCGAGNHPGGGVMGSAGRNAAAAVLEAR